MESLPTHLIRVVLGNGTTLETEDYFEDDDEAAEVINGIFENRETTWKEIGDIKVHFRAIDAIQVVAK